MKHLWVDIETTGLDPRTGRILELALVVTEHDEHGISQPIGKFERLIHCHKDTFLLLCNEKVQDMHVASGLAELCWHSSKGRGSVCAFADAREWLNNNAPRTPGPMCGSNPDFERRWFREHAPELLGYWSHRNIDLNSCRFLFQEPKDSKPHPHRALPDLMRDIANFNNYERFIQEARCKDLRL